MLVEMKGERKRSIETNEEEREDKDGKASRHSFVIYSVIFNFGDQLIYI